LENGFVHNTGENTRQLATKCVSLFSWLSASRIFILRLDLMKNGLPRIVLDDGFVGGCEGK